MNDIQTAADRKCICDDALALQNSQEYIAAQLQARIDLCYQKIISWCNTAIGSSRQIIIGVGSIPTETLTQWEQDLTAKGYVVVQENNAMTISHE